MFRPLVGLTLATVVLVLGCTTSEPATPSAETTTTALATTSTTLQTVTTEATATTNLPADTTDPPPEPFRYAVVAEERARRLAVIDPALCPGDEDGCELAPIMTIELRERPHNMTAVGSVVYATHPAAGAISRVDLAIGESSTVALGKEPHDVKYASAQNVLYVADEAGRALLTVDADTLAVIASLDLPGEPHDLVISDDTIWVTLRRRSELARVFDDQVALFPTGGSPHDLIVDENGMIWFSSWGSDILNIFDPSSGATVAAPAGVTEPHHFAIGPDGAVWVSDNGGSAVVGFGGEQPVTIEVGPVPHHLAFVGDTLVVAVSGSGEAILIESGQVMARIPLTTGLHGVAVVELDTPLAGLG